MYVPIYREGGQKYINLFILNIYLCSVLSGTGIIMTKVFPFVTERVSPSATCYLPPPPNRPYVGKERGTY